MGLKIDVKFFVDRSVLRPSYPPQLKKKVFGIKSVIFAVLYSPNTQTNFNQT